MPCENGIPHPPVVDCHFATEKVDTLALPLPPPPREKRIIEGGRCGGCCPPPPSAPPVVPLVVGRVGDDGCPPPAGGCEDILQYWIEFYKKSALYLEISHIIYAIQNIPVDQ